MKFTLKLFLIALSSVIITSHLTWKNSPVSEYTFEHYKLEFSKSYSTEAEHKMREMNYNEALRKVNEINSNPKYTWKAAINKFSDRMQNELNSLMGRNRNLSFSSAPQEVQEVQVKKSYYRIQAPSTHLKVESCRDIDSDAYGDKEGTCAEQGYTNKCYSCRGLIEFIVKNASTCDQEHTECYFKASDEVCFGTSQCPWKSIKNPNQSTLQDSEHFLKQLPENVDWRARGVTTPVKKNKSQYCIKQEINYINCEINALVEDILH